MNCDPRCDELQQLLRRHAPADPKEERSVALLLRYLDWLPRPFDATADPTHITASAIVLTADDAVLVHRHKRLGIYLQPGGHVNGTESPQDAAVRELYEETGVDAEPVTLVHVDCHQGPQGHVHLDLRYLFSLGDTDSFAPQQGESTDVRLVPYSWVMTDADLSLRRAVVAACVKR